jgi:hypothetical protein
MRAVAVIGVTLCTFFVLMTSGIVSAGTSSGPSDVERSFVVSGDDEAQLTSSSVGECESRCASRHMSCVNMCTSGTGSQMCYDGCTRRYHECLAGC